MILGWIASLEDIAKMRSRRRGKARNMTAVLTPK